jgi:hypothetical protein
MYFLRIDDKVRKDNYAGLSRIVNHHISTRAYNNYE